MPEVGVLTSKSIGPQPRLGYREPILTQCQPGSLVNAVGLTNPGAERAAEMMSRLDIPEDRFLLISIFGGSVEEYVAVARLLVPKAIKIIDALPRNAMGKVTKPALKEML